MFTDAEIYYTTTSQTPVVFMTTRLILYSFKKNLKRFSPVYCHEGHIEDITSSTNISDG